MSDSKKNGFSRRDFLKTGALSGLFLGGATLATGCNGAQQTDRWKGRAKNIIFMVSDGMSHGTLQMADLMRRRMEGRPSTWIRLLEENKANRALMDMTTGNSNVPDSAAAASSWGSGRRLTNGRVNMLDDGRESTPILPIFKNANRKTGLVTTTRITHATPAGFAANVMERGMEDEIAEQYYEREIDLMLGGGDVHFNSENREDGRDLYSDFAGKGYHVVKTKNELNGLNRGDGRVLGIFTDHHLPYELDHRNTPDLEENVPHLAEMTEFALDHLSSSGDGFILQVEGGRVDHGAHTKDAAGILYDQIAFDDAVAAVYRFYEANPEDTLVIVTTDHGNANPALNAAGPRYIDSVPNFDLIQNFTYTNNWIMRELDDSSSMTRIRARIEEATGIEVSREHARFLYDALRGNLSTAYDMRSRPMNVLGEIMSNYNSVAFTGSVHTADYVELAAFGPGSETIGAFTRNTKLFELMLDAAGIEFAFRGNHRETSEIIE